MNQELSKNIDIWVTYVLFSDRYTFKNACTHITVLMRNILNFGQFQN